MGRRDRGLLVPLAVRGADRGRRGERPCDRPQGPREDRSGSDAPQDRPMSTPADVTRGRLKQAAALALALGIWFTPVPAGLTSQAWHLFAIFAAAIFSVILNAFPLLTSAMLAVAAAVITRTLDPGKAFAGFANASVLLVVVA